MVKNKEQSVFSGGNTNIELTSSISVQEHFTCPKEDFVKSYDRNYSRAYRYKKMWYPILIIHQSCIKGTIQGIISFFYVKTEQILG